MVRDYIPSSDADFSNWFDNFATFCVGAGPGLGLSAPDISAITAENTAWQAAWQAHLSAQAKFEKREDSETLARLGGTVKLLLIYGYQAHCSNG